MFKCNDCGNIFEDPEQYSEKRDFWGFYCYEYFNICPICKSEDIEEEMNKEDPD